MQAGASEALTLAVEGNGGWEATGVGTTWWAAAAVQARVTVIGPLAMAARIDGIRQVAGRRGEDAAMPVLYAGPGLGSGTVTVEVRAREGVTLMIEARWDQAGSPQFFRGEVLGTGSEENPWEPNSMVQQTVLAGATAWF